MTAAWTIRDEAPGDEDAIALVTAAAFAGQPHSDGSEPAIVAGLRAGNALSVSLVADDGEIIGHVAFSPVSIGDGAGGWFGLGPVSVHPVNQRRGIGAALVDSGLRRLRESGAAGCVVLGDPAYYGRFGFEHDAALAYPGVPAGYFQCLAFSGARPRGTVTYHPGFRLE